ncbi:MAG: flagellar M-ring protein FliF [Alphaproteobacteria bacterium]|nr:flagellar M-ring protein FliF [Alphaproteobacteria bacterium]
MAASGFSLPAAAAPLVEAARRAPPRLKALAIAGTILVAAAAILAALWTPAMRPLYPDAADADRAAMLDALTAAGIAAAIDPATGVIRVPASEHQRARILLAADGLPAGAASGDDQIAAIALGASRPVEQARLLKAREADLEATIAAIDPVTSARVHIGAEAPSLFARDGAEPRAAIAVTLARGRALSPGEVAAIIHLVAAAVPNLSPDRVTLVDSAGRLLSGRDADGAATELEATAALEARYRRKLAAVLAPVLGEANYAAEVTVELDRAQSRSVTERVDRDATALRSEQGTLNNRSETAPAGIPGALSNTPPPAVPAAAPPQQGATAQSWQRQFDVSRETSERVEREGRVRRLTVAIAVRQSPRLQPADLQAIERLARGTVGIDTARGDTLSVVARPFSPPVEAGAQPWWEAPWLPLAAKAAATLALAILALVAVRRLLRRAPAPSDTLPPPAPPRVRIEDLRAAVSDDRQTATRALRQLLAAPAR